MKTPHAQKEMRIFVCSLQCDARSGTNGAPNHTEYLMKTVYYAECCHRRHQYLILSMCMCLCSCSSQVTDRVLVWARVWIKKTHTHTLCMIVCTRAYISTLPLYIHTSNTCSFTYVSLHWVFVLPMCVYVASRHEWYIYTMLYYILYITLSACVKPSDWYIVWTYSRAIHKAIISHMYICTNIL